MVCALLLGTAVSAQAGTPPKSGFLVDVKHGTIAGFHVGSPWSSSAGSLGLPDYALHGAPGVTVIWSGQADPSKAWAVATLPSSSSPRVVDLRLFSAFRTTRGDHRGTTLAAFKRHWASAGPVVSIVQRRRAVEYNVVVGDVVFAFDTHQTLQAVGVTSDDAESFCVLVSPCLGDTLSFDDDE